MKLSTMPKELIAVIKKYGYLEILQKDELGRAKYVEVDLPQHLAEGTPEDDLVIHTGMEFDDSDIEKLLKHRLSSSVGYLIAFVSMCTGLGIRLQNRFVQDILKRSTDTALKSELDKNQDSLTYEKNAKSALENNTPRRAYYSIRNHPELKKYMQPILQKCKLLAKKHESDISTTIAETCCRTIVQICLEQNIIDTDLEQAGDKLKNTFTIWALIAYYLVGKKEKMEGIKRHEGH